MQAMRLSESNLECGLCGLYDSSGLGDDVARVLIVPSRRTRRDTPFGLSPVIWSARSPSTWEFTEQRCNLVSSLHRV